MVILRTRVWVVAAILAAVLQSSAPAQVHGVESPCTCRGPGGGDYELDTCICINTAAGPQMACCGLVLNNTSWEFTGAPCPTALAPLPASGDGGGGHGPALA